MSFFFIACYIVGSNVVTRFSLILFCVFNRQIEDPNHNESDKQAVAAATDVIPIYNYVSSTENPLTWADVMALTYNYGIQVPPMSAVWVISMYLSKSVIVYRTYDFVFHFIPAALMDCASYICGKPAK